MQLIISWTKEYHSTDIGSLVYRHTSKREEKCVVTTASSTGFFPLFFLLLFTEISKIDMSVNITKTKFLAIEKNVDFLIFANLKTLYYTQC